MNVDLLSEEKSPEKRCNTSADKSRSDVLSEFHCEILTGNIQAVKKKLDTCSVGVNCAFKFNLSGKNTINGVGSRMGRERLLSITSTPLHTACIAKRLPLVKLLLDYGADPNREDSQQRVAALLVLLYWPRITPSCFQYRMTKEEKKYVIHIKKQHKIAAAMLELLIKRGAIISGSINRNNESLTHICARYNLIEAMKILINHNAPTDPQDSNGITPLLLAADVGNFLLMKLLISHGSNIFHTDHKGNSILHFLASTDRTASSRFLKFVIGRFNRNHNMTNKDGQTALHIACKHANEAAIHTLIKSGLNPDAQDNLGRTPLFELLNNVACLDAVYGLELLLQWTIHPKVYSYDGSLPHWLSHFSKAALREKLVSICDIPPTLQRICKVQVRRSMGIQRLNPYDIKRLPCPIGLANIILYNTAEWWQ